MKLIILIDDLASGGAENNLLNFLRHREKTLDAKVVTLFEGGALEDAFREIGIDVDCINFSIPGFFNSLKRLKQIISEHSTDVIVCQRSISRACYPMFLSKMNIKIVMHWDNPNIKQPFKAFVLERFQIKYADVFFASSKIISEELNRIYRITTAKIIANCIDSSKFVKLHKYRDLTGKRVKIVSVGNLREEKNHLDQLKIAKLLRNNGINFRLDILGEGFLRKNLEHKIKELNLSDNVFLQGRQENIPKWLNEADIFLFTSSSEGFGVAIIEAMAAALPCVIYDLPVLKEIDPQGECLKVVPNGGAELACKAIEEFISNREIRKLLGEKSCKLVHNNFSVEKIYNSWKSFLSNACEKR